MASNNVIRSNFDDLADFQLEFLLEAMRKAGRCFEQEQHSQNETIAVHAGYMHRQVIEILQTLNPKHH